MSKPDTITQDYSWADYMIYMEAGADIVGPAAPPHAAVVHKPSAVPGILAAAVIAGASIWISQLPVWPFTLASGKHPIDSAGIAIVGGIIAGNLLHIPALLQPGIKFTVKKILPLGIVLLGARLNMTDLVRVGVTGIVLSIVEIGLAFGLLMILGKKFGLGRNLAMLLGIGTGICGGSAILATAPVIEAEEEDVVFSVAVVSLLGTIAMFLYPVIGHLLQMSGHAFGMWSGLTLHQTPQVVAAGFSYSQEAGGTATIVKLARVCLLAPVVFFLGLTTAREKARAEGSAAKRQKIKYRNLIPTFIIGLFILVALRTLGLLPNVTFHLTGESIFGEKAPTFNLADICRDLSMLCIVISMAAAGLETKFDVFRRIGSAPLIAAAIAFVIVTSIMLALVQLLPL